MSSDSSLQKSEVSEILLYRLLGKAWSLDDSWNSGFHTDGYVSVQLHIPGIASLVPRSFKTMQSTKILPLCKESFVTSPAKRPACQDVSGECSCLVLKGRGKKR